MANNPVQVVLNAASYVRAAEAGGGGRNKDFYAGHDSEFLAHQASLDRQLRSVSEQLVASGSAFGIAHVALQSEAWAKSHRPTEKIFRADAPVVGVSDLGELLIEVTPTSIGDIKARIASAEPETRLVEDRSGKPLPKPSRVRSEVGALKDIRLHEASDRRSFSGREAAEWFRDQTVGSGYLVQFFHDPSSLTGMYAAELLDLRNRLDSMVSEISVEDLTDWWPAAGFAWIQFHAPPLQSLEDAIRMHDSILRILDSQPLVRKIWLPPVVANESIALFEDEPEVREDFELPRPESAYPTVAVVDTGVAEGALDPWVVGRVEMVDPALQDLAHGTFIAGLIADNGMLNSHAVMSEEPCKVFDLGLQVTDRGLAATVYRRGFVDLLDQLDFELVNATAAGVRVVNMSLAVEELVEDDMYSPYAAALDNLADKHDVIFVLPSGNLGEAQHRNSWPTSPADALAMLATYRYAGQDRMYRPAESLRAVTVGALEPARSRTVSERPSTYTRRGPGLGFGAKPDLAHIGGSAQHGSATGLMSFAADGSRIGWCGTSFASPLVAKSLARIDHLIEGAVTRETIIALGVHGARRPVVLDKKTLASVARDFVGYGVPQSARESLTTDDSSITLVFPGSMSSRKELSFEFAWPAPLTGADGKCRGDVTMTLVYSPPIDIKSGSEAVRVNLEAFLRQEHIHPDTGEVAFEGFFKSDGPAAFERERVREGQKWGPIKRWHRRTRPLGVGNSSQWVLVVEPLARSGEQVPLGGVPFTVILTISDPTGNAPIFEEMRRTLIASQVDLADIRVAQRIRA